MTESIGLQNIISLKERILFSRNFVYVQRL